MYLTLSTSDGADDQRFRAALNEIAATTPNISITTESQSIYELSGNSKSQLESICNRLCDEYQLGINAGPIKPVFLETIRTQSAAEGKYIRQTGGLGNYGHCKLRIEPNDPANGYEFINDIKGGAVPKEYLKPIDDGIHGAMKLGVLAGYPLVDVKVTLFDGSYHESDSNEMAFKFAGSIAFKEAARKASPVLLEPVMALEIDVPEKMATTIRREISLHRGRIEREESINGFSEIKAIVPLSELLTSSSLASAEIPMEFAGYEEVSDDGSSTDRNAGVTANKPSHPRPRLRCVAAKPEMEDE
jgi:elongation factor G